MRKRFASCALGACLLMGGLGRTRPAHAQTSPTRQCIDAHANGQVARGQGQLLEAKQQFVSCAANACPLVIRDDCAKFGSEVEAALPSVIVTARTSTGQELSSATVRIDGVGDALPVNGRALSINPGRHLFEVATPDGSKATVTMLIREAEKFQRVVAEFAVPAQPASETAERAANERGVSPLVYVFGGVGLVAASSFTYFALDGRSKEKSLEECAPHCARSDVDAMRRSYLIGDISLGVALASLGVGAYFLLRSPATSQSPGPGKVSVSTSTDLSAIRIRARVEF
jgi:hypothetical protein